MRKAALFYDYPPKGIEDDGLNTLDLPAIIPYYEDARHYYMTGSRYLGSSRI